MKISISLHRQNFEALGGIDAGFAALKEAGIEAIEYAFITPDINWEDMKAGKRSQYFEEEYFWEHARELKGASLKYGIPIEQCHAPMPSFISGATEEGNAIFREYMAQTIEFCGFCGTKTLIIHPLFDGSYRFPKLTKEDEVMANFDFYTSLIPLLKRHGVVCCLENMFTQDWKTKKIYTACCSDMNEAVYYIDAFNRIAEEELFGFCLDIGHLLVLGLDGKNCMEQLGSRVKALHIHDNDGFDDQHLSPYHGLNDWERFLKGLIAIDYEGNLNFENPGSLKQVPPALLPSVLRYTADVGNYFRARIEKTRAAKQS
ncbi:MAG: sugar phosphate isomerase/epimerase [Clostridia bacterium]|nr:sugar phosphate isomerase/epimerase [Clostridia bacterium]